MPKHRFQIDITAAVDTPQRLMLSPDEDLLEDDSGNIVALYEGMEIEVFDANEEPDGTRDDIIATGVVILNVPETSRRPEIKWLVRIDKLGIRYQSGPLKR